MAVLAPLLLLCLTNLALSNATQNGMWKVFLLIILRPLSVILFLSITPAVNNNYTLQLKQSKRYKLAVEQQYVFTVPVADASRENIGALVFQVHAQRHQIVLSEHSVPQYGFYTNGSHIGLYRMVLSENKTMQFYVRVSCLTSCGTSSNETALVLAAAVVVYNNCELCVCVCLSVCTPTCMYVYACVYSSTPLLLFLQTLPLVAVRSHLLLTWTPILTSPMMTSPQRSCFSRAM